MGTKLIISKQEVVQSVMQKLRSEDIVFLKDVILKISEDLRPLNPIKKIYSLNLCYIHQFKYYNWLL